MDLAFDFETYLIAPGRLAPRPVVMSTAGEGGPLLHTPDVAREVLRDVLIARHRLIGANAAFDLGVAVQAWPELYPRVLDAYEDGRIVDVQIVERLHLIAQGWTDYHPPTGKAKPGVSLAELAERYLGVKVAGKDGGDAWRFRYHELAGTPIDQWPEAAREYSRLDAEYTLRVWQAQGRELPPTYVEQARAAWALHCMAAWGVRTDPERVPLFRADLEARTAAVRPQLVAAGIIRPDGTKDTKAIQARVRAGFEARGETVPLTDKGAVKTDADALEACGDEVCALLAATLSDAKELDTWIPVLDRGTRLPVNPGFQVLGADSNRTSCRAPNLQNPPRRGGVRECFIPRPGNVFVSVDWNAAELRAFAQLCLDWFGHSRMAEAFRRGEDPHLIMAAAILGIPPEDAHRRRKDPEVKGARQLAKIPNFGFPGGLGPASFVDYAWSNGVDLCPEEYRSAPAAERRQRAEEHARELKNLWLATWPEAPLYLARIGQLADKDRDRGFRYELERTGFVRGGVGYTDGCNHGFQSMVATAGKRALWRVHCESYDARRRSVLFGFRPSLFVHDEIIGEAREDVAHEQAERLAAVMVECLGELCPDVPVTAEPALMRRWYKGAEPVYDAGGRLVPWEPARKSA